MDQSATDGWKSVPRHRLNFDLSLHITPACDMARTADTDWLTSPDPAPWLRLASDWSGGALALANRLRKDLSAERARLVLEQAELRRRATDKFSSAAGMFFTPRGVEQATDEGVGRYKAAHFPS